MTRRHTLHAPAAGIRLAVTTGTTIVLDPGPDERARRRNLTRERLLTAGVVVLTVVSVELLRTSESHDRPWTLAAGLLLSAAVCHAARPGRRTVPGVLVDVLEPLRATLPARPGEIHRLVWEAVGLISAEASGQTPFPESGGHLGEQIHARLRVLTAPVTRAATGLRASPTSARCSSSRPI
ncbi:MULTISPECIES: hypothetical protein [Promicromonospora]|uniref:Uncharacterized protein n=2 Tax=Promicromonospora TaxID=43676 RepID=A0ABW4UZN8_9MICO